jgi:AraC family transcriptional regulator
VGHEGAGEVEASTLQGGPAAVIWHIGPYETLEVTYAAVEVWPAERSLEPDGSPWEAYCSDPKEQPDPATWRTEIVQPFRTL